jgi:hypothetical protein
MMWSDWLESYWSTFDEPANDDEDDIEDQAAA